MFFCSFIVMHLTINRDSTAYVDKTGIFCILQYSYLDEVKFSYFSFIKLFKYYFIVLGICMG